MTLLQIFIATSGISAVAAVLGCGMTASAALSSSSPRFSSDSRVLRHPGLGIDTTIRDAWSCRGDVSFGLRAEPWRLFGGSHRFADSPSAEPGVSEAMVRAESLAMADEYCGLRIGCAPALT